MHKVTLGVVPYINVLPLIEGLLDLPWIRMVRRVPSELSEMLRKGEVDAATLPIFDAAAEGDYRVVPGISISSRGAVGSVRLFHRGELATVRTVLMDAASRSSAALIRILMEKRFGLRPVYVEAETGGGETDAFLRIGDDCLLTEEDGYRWLDLGEAWTEWTGLPFVYAAWVLRGEEIPGLPETLQEARSRGLEDLPRIARQAAERLGGDPDTVDSYLRRKMRYDLGGEEKEGIALFFRHAADLGLLPEAYALRFAPSSGD